MTNKKLVVILDNLEQQLDLIGIAIDMAEVRPGYSHNYKTSALKWIRESQDKIKLAISELDRLR